MNKIIALCFAAMFLAMFTTGDLIAAEKTKPAQKKAATKKISEGECPEDDRDVPGHSNRDGQGEEDAYRSGELCGAVLCQ